MCAHWLGMQRSVRCWSPQRPHLLWQDHHQLHGRLLAARTTHERQRRHGQSIAIAYGARREGQLSAGARAWSGMVGRRRDPAAVPSSRCDLSRAARCPIYNVQCMADSSKLLTMATQLRAGLDQRGALTCRLRIIAVLPATRAASERSKRCKASR
jgi:hypothetical protein